MKYQVKIIETLSRIVEVDAHSNDEAWDKVKAQYDNEEIVLGSEDFDGYEIYGLGEVKDGNENQ